MTLLDKNINNAAIIANQQARRREKLVIFGTAAAGKPNQPFSTHVNTDGPFWLQRISGSFTRLIYPVNPSSGVVSANLVDDGGCHLRAVLYGANQQQILFQNPVSLCNFLSPGGVRSPIAGSTNVAQNNNGSFTDAISGLTFAQAPASGTLYRPDEFEYVFAAKSDIYINIFNDSNAPNDFEIVLDGVRFLQ